MRFSYLPIFGFICTIFFLYTNAELILIGSVIATSVATIMTSYFFIPEMCMFKECCSPLYIRTNLSVKDIERNLSTAFFGQHIALHVVSNLINDHLEKQDPEKALVFSFHGDTGVGKSYMTKLLAELLYEKGINSQFVHLFIPDIHFGHAHVSNYNSQLVQWIRGNVTKCASSVFIFDEVENLPPSLIDVLKFFMDSYAQLDGVDYRKSIFIFLSNIGAPKINDYALQHHQKGFLRKDISHAVMDRILRVAALNDPGGFFHSKLIKHDLISAFVPFLPLEKDHVRLCIRKYLKEQNRMDKNSRMEDSVLDRLEFKPDDNPLYATSGCRRIPEFVAQL